MPGLRHPTRWPALALVLASGLGTGFGLLACNRVDSPTPPADAEAADDPPADEARRDAGGEPIPEGVVGGVLGGPPDTTDSSPAVPPPRPGSSPEARWTLPPHEQRRVDAIRDREMALLEQDPAYEAYLLRGIDPSATPEQAYERGFALGHILARRGIARLDDASLRFWSDMRLKMSGTALEICVGLWTGQLPPGALDWSMATLDDEELAKMMRLTADGGLAELRAKSPLQPDPEALQRGMERIGALLSEDDRTRFFETIQGIRTAPEDQCFVVQRLHGTIGRVESPLRERFLRALAVAMAQ